MRSPFFCLMSEKLKTPGLPAEKRKSGATLFFSLSPWRFLVIAEMAECSFSFLFFPQQLCVFGDCPCSALFSVYWFKPAPFVRFRFRQPGKRGFALLLALRQVHPSIGTRVGDFCGLVRSAQPASLPPSQFVRSGISFLFCVFHPLEPASFRRICHFTNIPFFLLLFLQGAR